MRAGAGVEAKWPRSAVVYLGGDMVRPIVDPRFAETLRRLRLQRGLSLRGLAARAYQGKSTIHDLETGRKQPLPDVVKRLDEFYRPVAN